MGKELYASSYPFRSSIEKMQQSLDSLPAKDKPTWNLVDQLYAPTETSRVAEATVSQPLCTALQVALVDVLDAAGIKFFAVVGHSSGEIGAAYAAGYLSATDAVWLISILEFFFMSSRCSDVLRFGRYVSNILAPFS